MDQPAFDEMLKRARGATGDDRLSAIDQMGLSGNPQTVPHLAELLGSPETLVRRHAAWALQHLGTPAAIEVLRTALREGDEWVRLLVTRALGKHGAEADVPDLLSALNDPNEGVRETAIDALRELCGPRAEGLIEARLSFVPAAMRPADPGALDFTCWDECPACGEQAGWTGEIRDSYTQAMECPACRNRFWQCGGAPVPGPGETWRKMDPEAAMGRLREALRMGPGKVREWAVGALAHLGARSCEALVEALRDRAAEVRGKAAWALGALGDPRAVEALRSLQQDPDGCVRSVAKLARRRIEAATETRP